MIDIRKEVHNLMNQAKAEMNAGRMSVIPIAVLVTERGNVYVPRDKTRNTCVN